MSYKKSIQKVNIIYKFFLRNKNSLGVKNIFTSVSDNQEIVVKSYDYKRIIACLHEISFINALY